MTRTSSTISMRPALVRCAPTAINLQTAAKRSKSCRFADSSEIPLEVRNDALEEIPEPSCFPLQRLVAAIRSDAPASEVRLNRTKHLGTISILTHREARPHLPSH